MLTLFNPIEPYSRRIWLITLFFSWIWFCKKLRCFQTKFMILKSRKCKKSHLECLIFRIMRLKGTHQNSTSLSVTSIDIYRNLLTSINTQRRFEDFFCIFISLLQKINICQGSTSGLVVELSRRKDIQKEQVVKLTV